VHAACEGWRDAGSIAAPNDAPASWQVAQSSPKWAAGETWHVRQSRPLSCATKRSSASAGAGVSGPGSAIFEGKAGSGAVITDSILGSGVEIRPYCVITGSTISDDAAVGPFAHLRAGTEIGKSARIGNYVETKMAVIGNDSKVSHLTYVGDAELGEGVNIGAGCVTCNYDGINKFRTVIEDGVFVGSGTMMVAPITLGKGSLVAAGSTLTRDVPPDALAIARGQQSAKEGWAAARREKLTAEKKKEKS
jgi:bifunctional N-acetylglucosamine-1-phosphate-uridyltransferase/glucosamine-1-phosphate-acetyltransferase GlmU-like protein